MKPTKKMKKADKSTVFGAILSMTDDEIAKNCLCTIPLTGHPVTQSDVDEFRVAMRDEMRKWLIEEGYVEDEG